MRKEKIVPIIAIIVVLIGVFSNLYVYAKQVDSDDITINGQEYSIDQILFLGNEKTIETSKGEQTGVALDDLILKSGVACPSCHEYTIKGKDGYQKTVKWENMKNGVLTDYAKVYFSDTPRSYWVGDVIEIEVI